MGKKKHRQILRKKGLPPGTLVYTGHREKRPVTVHSLWYTDGEHQLRDAFAPEIAHTPGGTLWVDLSNLSDAAFIERVGNHFQIHPLALEDVLNTQQRAKLDEYDNGLFLVLPNLRFDTATMELNQEQITIFATQNAVVSFQEDPDDTFQPVRVRLLDGLGKLQKKGADFLLYSLADTVVDQYYLVLDDIETTLLDLEADLHNNGANPACKARIFQLKYIVNQFRHRVVPLRDAVTRLYRSDSPIIDDSNRLYLRDLADHVAQILDGVDNSRDLLANVEALFQSEVSNRLNNVMRLLTVISTIFIPLSFIAGVYGMNFDNMPELHWHYGYFIILGLMFAAMVLMLIYFRRNKWI